MGRRNGTQSRPAPAGDFEWIASDAGLADLAETLAGFDIYGIDTEFHREKTYWPTLALIQIGWAEGIALIDPLAIDPRGMAKIFELPATAVMHAASQDIEVFAHSVGTVPTRLFDTQIAAGFVGYGSPALSSLIEGELGLTIAKGDRLTDWLRRPLEASQQAYAAADVAHLLDLHALLVAKLNQLNRLEWVDTENEIQRRWRPNREPERAYVRIKETRLLKGRALGVAVAVAAWRERRAAQLDMPVRHVLADLAVVGIANKAPTSVDDLQGIRGLDDRLRRGELASSILAAVQTGLHDGPPPRPARSPSAELDRELRPAVSLISAWVAQLGKSHSLDTALLATRSDIEELLGSDSGRLSVGWRNELVGKGIKDLLAGRAALAFDGRELVLEPRVNE